MYQQWLIAYDFLYLQTIQFRVSTCLHVLMHWPPMTNLLGDAHCFGCQQHNAIAGSCIVKFVPHGVSSWKLDRCLKIFCWWSPCWYTTCFKSFQHMSLIQLDTSACQKQYHSVLSWCKSMQISCHWGIAWLFASKESIQCDLASPTCCSLTHVHPFSSCKFCENAKPPIWYCITKSQWIPCAFNTQKTSKTNLSNRN